MEIKEYQLEASRTCVDLREDNFTHMKMGVMTEIGEIVDIFKKNLAYKKEIDLVHLGEEIADCAWYIVNWDTFNGVLSSVKETAKNKSLGDVLQSLDFINQYYSIYLDDDFFETNEQLGLLKGVADYYNLDFYELLDKNIAKLKARFPDKFTEEAALNRNLEKEREILEGNAG